MTSSGTFLSDAVAGLATLRRVKLGSTARHPHHIGAMDGQPTTSPDELANRLTLSRGTSAVGVALSTPDLDDAALLAVAERLGSVMPETDLETRPFVSSAAVWEMAFRDFRDEPLAWSNDADAEPAAVNAALAQLALAMYTVPMYALAMQPGMIVYLANARVAHGRTAFAQSDPQRLLRRICLQQTPCNAHRVTSPKPPKV
jgi:Taurine catabolism dioxygenase TauD, TfdA family